MNSSISSRTGSGFHRTNAGGIDGYVCRMNNTATIISAATYVGTSDYDQAYFEK
jgi:hypothetical protein